MLLDPFMASLKSKTSSIDPYIKGEVWSLLSALEIPYTPQKNYTYQNHIWATTFVRKNFVRPPLLGGPLVKFSKIGTIQYYSP